MPTITDQRVFLPARDFAQSLDFYQRMGWRLRFQERALALLELGASHILVQDYYQENWAGNSMLHFAVDDAAAWYARAVRVKSDGGFDTVQVMVPQRADYGALVTHVVDPAGVLLHFAQHDPA